MVVGGRKGQEAGGDGQRGEGQLASDAAARRHQGLTLFLAPTPLGAEADAELDAEVDAQAHEERDEGHRDDVEAVVDQQPPGRRHDETGQGGDQDGRDQPRRLHRQPQHQHDGPQRQERNQQGAIRQGAELVVLQRSLAGETHIHPVGGIQIQALGHRPDGVGGLRARFQLIEVELGVHQDQVAKLARVGLSPGDHGAPGEVGRLALVQGFQGVGQAVDRPVQVLQGGLARTYPLQRGVQRVRHAAQAGIGGHRAQEGLGGDQLVHVGLHIGQGRIEQAVPGPEGARIRKADAGEQLGVDLELLRQGVGRLFRQLRGLAVDDDDDLGAVLRERPVEGRFLLAPWQGLGDEVVGVRADGEMAGRIDRRRHAQEQADDHHHQGVVGAERDPATGA